MLRSRVKAVSLQTKLGKQDFQVFLKNVSEPVTDTIKNTADVLTNTMMLISKENNEALESLNNKLLEILNDRSIIQPYLISPPSKISNSEK